MFKFTIEGKAKTGRARAGIIKTPHGDIETPAFIPVATKGTVKALTPEMLSDLGAQAVLANTYHLYLQPGTDLIKNSGGLGKFMNWSGPTFTDSGGFQAFSLGPALGGRQGKIANPNSNLESRISNLDEETAALKAKINDDGVTFKSVIDGSSHHFTPERSIEIQHDIGADIIFAFDECLSPHDDYERQKAAVNRTYDWAKRCITVHQKSKNEQALFGIVQGGRHEDLRKLSAKQIRELDFAGFGIGGSFDKDDIGTAVGWVADELPEDKPRHLLGIGSEPRDLILGIANGMDTFDCVAPTRIARNGAVYIGESTINLTNAKFTNDLTPIDQSCDCYTCKHYSKAYLAHLFRAKEMLAATLASIHNLYSVVNLVKSERSKILNS